MPAYNAEKFIASSISSVLNQSYNNWELIIINDGSTDETENAIKIFQDQRIKYHKKENGGVSSARNLALKKMQGDFFCFLDADDELTKNSVSDRLNGFKSNEKINFIDGIVKSINRKNGKTFSTYKPKFRGCPKKELAKLNENCFFGITWMIKRNRSIKYKFRENFSHAEDIVFYIDYCTESSFYTYINEPIYIRNITSNSAMSDINSLEKGYLQFYNLIKEQRLLTENELNKLNLKIKKILLKSYISEIKFLAALNILFHKF